DLAVEIETATELALHRLQLRIRHGLGMGIGVDRLAVDAAAVVHQIDQLGGASAVFLPSSDQLCSLALALAERHQSLAVGLFDVGIDAARAVVVLRVHGKAGPADDVAAGFSSGGRLCPRASHCGTCQ